MDGKPKPHYDLEKRDLIISALFHLDFEVVQQVFGAARVPKPGNERRRTPATQKSQGSSQKSTPLPQNSQNRRSRRGKRRLHNS